MTRPYLFLITFMLAATISLASAETYTWTDEQGTIHFTEDLGNVPQKMRNKVRGAEEAEPPREETRASAPAAKAPDASPQAVPANGDTGSGVYAGKTYDEWKKDLAEREAAMDAVKARIEELVVLRKNLTASREVRDNLFEEHKSLLAKFNDMKAQYFQQVEIARKAGLTVNLQ